MEERKLNAVDPAGDTDQAELDRLFGLRDAQKDFAKEKQKAKQTLEEALRRKEQERTRKLRRNLLQMLAWMALGIATVAAVKAQLVHPYIGSSILSICLLSEGWLLRAAQALAHRNG